MAIVGHWDSLAEAQKLTLSKLLAGIVQTVIESGHLTKRLPVYQVEGKSILYNREDDWTAKNGAAFYDVHEQIPWNADITYTQKEAKLKICARQDALDSFIADTYRDTNDPRAILIAQLTKRVTRFIERELIYGDSVNSNTKGFDGIHALAAAGTGDLNIDGANTALALGSLRAMLDACKVDTEQAIPDKLPGGQVPAGKAGVFILTSRTIGRRIDSGYEEAGLVRSGVTHSLGRVTFGRNEAGGRITYFDGLEIIRSDFLVAEQAEGALDTTTARAEHSSGTKNYSIFCVRPGMIEDGGLAFLFGGPAGEARFGGLLKHKSFDALEDFLAGGERVWCYPGIALGAQNSLGRIVDITDAAVTP